MAKDEQVSMTAPPVTHGRIQARFSFAAALLSMLTFANPAFASGHAPSSHVEAEAAEEINFVGLKVRGIELGEFRVRAYYPVDAQKSTVRFVLHLAVASEHYQEMKQLVDDHEHKLRDQIITATRMTPLALFDEPNLDAFRRRIFMRLRRTLPELVIDDIYVSEFQLTVKSL